MRKNSPRKWLHACLDLLPVILIPVFMVYSHRHTIDGGSITREEPTTYNLQQVIENGEPTSTDNYSITSGAIMYYSNDSLYIDNLSTFQLTYSLQQSLVEDDFYYYSYNLYNHGFEDEGAFSTTYAMVTDYVLDSGLNHISGITDLFLDADSLIFEFFMGSTYSFNNFQLFDLTAIFGSGNEPSKEEFESLLTQDYYDYGVDYEVTYGTHQVTYNDTDIMSQFTYQLYNAVDKYFNMGNVFNMNGVYEWFNTNIFGGNAPISIYIVWNIVLYEFVMDLLFLLYGLFMWFIDMVQHIMDKPFKSIK